MESHASSEPVLRLGFEEVFIKEEPGCEALESGMSTSHNPDDPLESGVPIKEEDLSSEYSQDDPTLEVTDAEYNNRLLPSSMATSPHTLYRMEDPKFPAVIKELLCSKNLEEALDYSDADEDGTKGEPSSAEDENTDDSDPSELDNSSDASDLKCDTPDVLPSTLKEAYFGRNGMKWNSQAVQKEGETAFQVDKMPGLSKYATEKLGSTPSEMTIWLHLFSDDIIDDILTWTNHQLTAECPQSKRRKPITEEELLAFFGLLMMTSIYKSNKESIHSLFRNDLTGRPIFRAVMTPQRFFLIQASLRFDNPLNNMSQEDRAAAVSNVFSLLIQNGRSLYTPSDSCAVDETMVPVRRGCSLPGDLLNRRGLKVITLSDTRTGYFYNAFVDSGKAVESQTNDLEKLPRPTQLLLQVTNPIHGSNRTITANSQFSSIQAVRELTCKKLTFVGTLNKNEAEIPPEFSSTKKPLKHILYGFSDDGITLVSRKEKSNTMVHFVSSKHHDSQVDASGHPAVIGFYNNAKDNVDICEFHRSVRNPLRKNPRWPLCVFHVMMNISIVNAFIIHKFFNSSILDTRNDFTRELALQLVKPHLESRRDCPNTKLHIKLLIDKVLSPKDPRRVAPGPEKKLGTRKLCSRCPYTRHRKTSYICIACKDPICLQCSRKMCMECVSRRKY